MFQKLLKGDTAVWRGIRTGVQALIAFFVGLVATVWAVPGVPEAVTSYVSSNLAQLAVGFGVSTGVVALVWNLLRKDVNNK